MKSLHNVEKSAFVNGDYVAYGRGAVWAVRRAATGWVAFCRMSQFPCVYGRTLADISKLVEG